VLRVEGPYIKLSIWRRQTCWDSWGVFPQYKTYNTNYWGQFVVSVVNWSCCL